MAVDRSLEVRAVAAVFFALASVTTILRCYVRLAVVKAFGWDDGVMVLALVSYPLFPSSMAYTDIVNSSSTPCSQAA